MLTGVRDTGNQDMHEVNAKGILLRIAKNWRILTYESIRYHHKN